MADGGRSRGIISCLCQCNWAAEWKVSLKPTPSQVLEF